MYQWFNKLINGSYLQNAAYCMDEVFLILRHAPLLPDPVHHILLVVAPDDW